MRRGPSALTREGEVALLLGAVDGGVGGRVDDHVGDRHGVADRCGVPDVELGAREGGDGEALARRLPAQLALSWPEAPVTSSSPGTGYLAGAARGAVARRVPAGPRRSARNGSAPTRPGQVPAPCRRGPKLRRGAQPSSARALPSSIAVARVVAGAVRDEGDQALARRAARPLRVDRGADRAHHVDVPPLAGAAEVVASPTRPRVSAASSPWRGPRRGSSRARSPRAVDRQRSPASALMTVSGISFSGNW